MAPVILINIRVMRPSTANVVAAEPVELELEPELEFEDEPEPDVDEGIDEGVEEKAFSGVVVAAELSIVEEAAAGATVLDAAADSEPEPPKQSIPLPAQKNCTVPQVCPNLQVHSSSL